MDKVMQSLGKRIADGKYCKLLKQVAEFQQNLHTAHLKGDFSLQSMAIDFLAMKGLLSDKELSKFIDLLAHEMKAVHAGHTAEAVAKFDQEVIAFLRKKYAAAKRKLKMSRKSAKEKGYVDHVGKELDCEFLLNSEKKEVVALSPIYTSYAIGAIAEVLTELEMTPSIDVQKKLSSIPIITKRAFVNFIKELSK